MTDGDEKVQEPGGVAAPAWGLTGPDPVGRERGQCSGPSLSSASWGLTLGAVVTVITHVSRVLFAGQTGRRRALCPGTHPVTQQQPGFLLGQRPPSFPL